MPIRIHGYDGDKERLSDQEAIEKALRAYTGKNPERIGRGIAVVKNHGYASVQTFPEIGEVRIVLWGIQKDDIEEPLKEYFGVTRIVITRNYSPTQVANILVESHSMEKAA